MFLVFKNRLNIILSYALIFVVLFVGNGLVSTSVVATSPSDRFSVVIDAGHGGIDTGCTGISGSKESELCLSIALRLQSYLTSLGIHVIQTRTNADGLYGTFASGFKLRDLEARAKIIKSANPNLVISIHMNAYTDSVSRGAQVFYAPNSEVSHEFADNMQSLFISHLPSARKSAMLGDYYILKCTDTPGILIECGFLSNPEEEALLISPKYQDKLAYTITCGVLSYFDLSEF